MKQLINLANNKTHSNGAGYNNTAAVRVLFLGKYPNWPENITDWAIYPEVLEYWDNPSDYWKKYGRYHPMLSENAFDPVTGGYGDGYRYHINFSTLGLTPDYADYVAFTELIGVPVSGVMNYRDPIQKALDEAEFERLLQNPEHLAFLKNLLFEAKNKVIFTSRSVYNIIKTRQWELFGLEQDLLTTPFPQDPYEFRILYEHDGSYIIAAQIFSSITDDAYYPRYRRMIDAVIFGFVMQWEVVMPGNTAKLSLTCSFHDLLSNLKSIGYNIDSLMGISINPVKRVMPNVYQLPVLKEFFSNMESDWSIQCLIHGIAGISEKARCIPHIKDFYNTFRHLLEPDNRSLIEGCLEESSRLIANNDNILPATSESIRDVFYRFSFRSFKGLEDIAPGDYYYAEKVLLHTIWNTVLDNLYRHGCGEKASIEVIPDRAVNLLTIEVVDLFNLFSFIDFLKADKSAITYAKMSRFGELSIQSGSEIWSSDNPSNATQAPEYVEGTKFKLKFVLPED